MIPLNNQDKLQCCPIFCLPTYQKPHNIIRTINLFDLFMVILVVVPTLVGLRNHTNFIIPRLIIFFSSGLMFFHSLAMVIWYNKMVSQRKLVKKGKVYAFSRV